jgi:hypothetical protein
MGRSLFGVGVAAVQCSELLLLIPFLNSYTLS